MALICFDLDETLIESNEAHFHAFNLAFQNNKLKTLPRYKIIPLLNGRHATQIVKKLFPKLSKNKIKKVVQDHHRFLTKTAKYAKPIKGAKQTLKKLKRCFKLALISNCTHKEIDLLLKNTNISKRLFDIIIGKDDVKKTKPYPDEIFKAEKLLKINADYHIGDSIYDILAGKRANVRVIAVLSGITVRERLKKAKPYKIINTIKDLPKVI